jgi:hypothetical protein
MLDIDKDKVILLFFKKFERDSFFKNDRYIKRLIRPITSKFMKKQVISGFEVWNNLLIKALKSAGYSVYLNNYSLARRNPHYPVGLVGYPHLLDDWNLPNPAILGPSLLDHPKQSPLLMENPGFKSYIVTCDWMQEMFKPVYGDKVKLWHAGIDVNDWPDTKLMKKSTDVLIYDKVRWNREKYEPELINPIQAYLKKKGLSTSTIRYGAYRHSDYAEELAQSKAMIFLCEHETQGMAYQEALSSNVPIMAWENGYWLDPRRPEYDPNPVRATSVPYFSSDCGEKFADFAGFESKFDTFSSNLDSYSPRKYIENNLSFEESAQMYLELYNAAGENCP